MEHPVNRQQKINAILERGPEDTRRLALDVIDKEARDTNTFGSAHHRTSRDKVERTYDDARKTLDALSDDQLDALVAAGV